MDGLLALPLAMVSNRSAGVPSGDPSHQRDLPPTKRCAADDDPAPTASAPALLLLAVLSRALLPVTPFWSRDFLAAVYVWYTTIIGSSDLIASLW